MSNSFSFRITKNKFASTTQNLSPGYVFAPYIPIADVIFRLEFVRTSKDWIKEFLNSLNIGHYVWHEPRYVNNVVQFLYSEPEKEKLIWNLFSNYSALKECFPDLLITPPQESYYKVGDIPGGGYICLVFEDLEGAAKIAKMKLILEQLNDV